MVFLYYIDRVLLLFTVAAKCYFIENAFNLIPNVQVSMEGGQGKRSVSEVIFGIDIESRSLGKE